MPDKTPDEVIADLRAQLATANELIGRLYTELAHKKEIKRNSMMKYRTGKGKPPISPEERSRMATEREAIKRERNAHKEPKMSKRIKEALANGEELTTFDIASRLLVGQRYVSKNLSSLLESGQLTKTRTDMSPHNRERGYYQLTEKGRASCL